VIHLAWHSLRCHRIGRYDDALTAATGTFRSPLRWLDLSAILQASMLAPAVILLLFGVLSLRMRGRISTNMQRQNERHPRYSTSARFIRVYPVMFACFSLALSALCFVIGFGLLGSN
jgi:hypothetical protein